MTFKQRSVKQALDLWVRYRHSYPEAKLEEWTFLLDRMRDLSQKDLLPAIQVLSASGGIGAAAKSTKQKGQLPAGALPLALTGAAGGGSAAGTSSQGAVLVGGVSSSPSSGAAVRTTHHQHRPASPGGLGGHQERPDSSSSRPRPVSGGTLISFDSGSVARGVADLGSMDGDIYRNVDHVFSNTKLDGGPSKDEDPLHGSSTEFHGSPDALLTEDDGSRFLLTASEKMTLHEELGLMESNRVFSVPRKKHKHTREIFSYFPTSDRSLLPGSLSRSQDMSRSQGMATTHSVLSGAGVTTSTSNFLPSPHQHTTSTGGGSAGNWNQHTTSTGLSTGTSQDHLHITGGVSTQSRFLTDPQSSGHETSGDFSSPWALKSSANRPPASQTWGGAKKIASSGVVVDQQHDSGAAKHDPLAATDNRLLKVPKKYKVTRQNKWIGPNYPHIPDKWLTPKKSTSRTRSPGYEQQSSSLLTSHSIMSVTSISSSSHSASVPRVPRVLSPLDHDATPRGGPDEVEDLNHNDKMRIKNVFLL